MEIIKLNLIPNGVNPTCHCSQYDEERAIRIELFDGLTPYTLQSGDTVTLNVRKPDNTIVTTTVETTQGNNYVDILTTEQICACVGYNLCDLTITNGSKVIGTLNFIMAIERDVLADGIPSQSVIKDLDALVQEAVGDNYYTKAETDASLALKANNDQIFETVYPLTDVDNLPSINTYKLYNAAPSGNNKITFAQNSGLDSYYLISDRECDIYFGNTSGYVSIVIGNNFTEKIDYTSSFDLFCDNPVRYRSSDNNLPTIDNKLHIKVGDVVAFTFDKNAMSAIYGYISEEIVNQDFKNEILYGVSGKSPFILYKNNAGEHSSNERVDIYIPQSKGYILYSLVHTISASINVNIWRMGYTWYCNDNFEKITQLTIDGEWECAVKLDGRDDFSGGYAHGDQILSTIKFFVDGANVDITSFTTLTPINNFVCVQSSELFDPANNSNKIADLGCVHIFNNEGLTIKQALKWAISDTLSTCFLAMFPVSKSVSDSFYTNIDYNPRSITFGTFSKDINDVTLYKNNGDYTFDFSIPEYVKGLSGEVFLLTDNGGYNYNKCYYQVCNSGTVSINDLWQTMTKYKITANVS
jgi:hypothetical protein